MALNKEKALKQADKHISKQNYNKALTELLKVVKVTPNDVNLLNKIGDLYSKTGNTKSAIEYFNKVADSYASGGFNLKAIALYKKIIRIDSTYLDARQRLVDLYIQQGHHSEAKGELRRMAEHYYNENLFPRALSCYEKLVEIEPHNLDARLKITELLIKEGKREQATTHFVTMATDLLEKTMVNEARKILSQGLNLDPGNEQLEVLMTRCLLAEGKVDEALNRLTEICEESPNNQEALRILGDAYLEKNLLDEAKACFLRAFAISGEDTGMLEEVASRLIQENRLDDAFECFEPLADALLQDGKNDETVRLFRHILYKNENHVPSLARLADIYVRVGQQTNAILSYEKAINHLLQLGKQDTALTYIDRLLELDPDNYEWREKQASLTGGSPVPEEPEPFTVDEPAQIFEETGPVDATDLSELDLEDSVAGDLDASLAVGMDESESSKIANHLTEADVYLKYQALDHATKHLLEVQNLDPLNQTANARLREIYLQKGEVQNAILCMVRLLNGAIERRDYADAETHVAAIAEHRPDVAEQHRARLAALRSEDSQQIEEPAASPFDLDFGESEQDGLQIGQPGEQDVVDFREMSKQTAPSFDLGEGAEIQGDDDQGWSLDMPDTTLDEDGLGDDFKDLYNPAEQTLSEGADEMPSLDAIRAGFEGALGEEAESTEDFTEQLEIPEDAPPEIEDSIEVPDAELMDLGDPIAEVPAVTAPEPDLVEDLTDLPEAELLDAEEEAEALPEPALSVGDASSAPEEEAEASDPTEKTGFGLLDLEETSEEVDRRPPASEPVHAPLESSQGSLAGELEEIDFFISVDAFDDASNLIAEARKHFGDHPLLLERENEVAAKTQAPPPAGTKLSEPRPPASEDKDAEALLTSTDGNGFFDLAASLSEELFDDEAQVDINDKTSQEEIQTVEELFEEFKKGVDEQIDASDTETHYDLGIAYKEMGLLEEAIAEFEIANQDANRMADCATMIGHCLIELGRVAQAIENYEQVLTKVADAAAKVPLQYELALLYQDTDKHEQALALLLQIKETDPDYRDLEELIEAFSI